MTKGEYQELVEIFDGHFGSMHRRFDSINEWFDRLNQRFDASGRPIAGSNHGTETVDDRLDAASALAIDALDHRFDRLEHRFDDWFDAARARLVATEAILDRLIEQAEKMSETIGRIEQLLRR